MLLISLEIKPLFMCFSSTFPPFALAFQTLLSTPLTLRAWLHPHYLNAGWNRNVCLPSVRSYTLQCNYNNLYQILQANGSAIIARCVWSYWIIFDVENVIARTNYCVLGLHSPVSIPHHFCTIQHQLLLFCTNQFLNHIISTQFSL